MLKGDNVKRSARRGEEGNLVNNGLDVGIAKIVRSLSNVGNSEN